MMMITIGMRMVVEMSLVYNYQKSNLPYTGNSLALAFMTNRADVLIQGTLTCKSVLYNDLRRALSETSHTAAAISGIAFFLHGAYRRKPNLPAASVSIAVTGGIIGLTFFGTSP